MVASSLYAIPATYEELYKRDFLLNVSHYQIDTAIKSLYADSAIYERGEKLYVYLKYMQSENMKEYLL